MGGIAGAAGRDPASGVSAGGARRAGARRTGRPARGCPAARGATVVAGWRMCRGQGGVPRGACATDVAVAHTDFLSLRVHTGRWPTRLDETASTVVAGLVPAISIGRLPRPVAGTSPALPVKVTPKANRVGVSSKNLARSNSRRRHDILLLADKFGVVTQIRPHRRLMTAPIHHRQGHAREVNSRPSQCDEPADAAAHR